MSVSTCVVRDYIYKQDGSPDAGARVTATLSRWEVDLDEGYIGPAEVETVTNDEGYFELELFPQQDGSTESVYVVRIEGAERSLAVKAVVPAFGQVWLRDVASLPAFPGKPDGQAAIEAAAEALASAQEAVQSATAAEGFADAAAQSALDAADSASAAADSAEAAQASEENAEDLLPYIGPTEPEEKFPGKEWIRSTDGRRFNWFVDEDDNGQWVEMYAVEVISNEQIADAVDDALAVQLPPAVEAAVDIAVGAKMEEIDAAVEQAGQARDDAAAYAEVAAAAGKVYPTSEDGVDPVAGVADGDFYWVPSDASASVLELWQNVEGAAVDTGKRTPSVEYVDNVGEVRRRFEQPNLFTRDQLLGLAAPLTVIGGTVTPTVVDGVTCLRFAAPAAGECRAVWRFARSAIQGNAVSTAFIIQQGDAGTSGNYARLVFRDSSAVQISLSGATVPATAVTQETIISQSNVNIPEGTAYIDVDIRFVAQAGNARNVDVRALLLCGGELTDFRMPDEIAEVKAEIAATNAEVESNATRIETVLRGTPMYLGNLAVLPAAIRSALAFGGASLVQDFSGGLVTVAYAGRNEAAASENKTTYYFSSTGSNSNDGLSRTSPKRSLGVFLNNLEPTTDIEIIIVGTAGQIFRRDDSLAGVTWNKPYHLSIRAETEAIISSSEPPGSISWTADDNAYTATLSAVGTVFDASIRDYRGVPIPLKKVASVAEVKALAGSWCLIGTQLTIRTHDDRAPDASLIINRTTGVFAASLQANKQIYLENIKICQFTTNGVGVTISAAPATNTYATLVNSAFFGADNNGIGFQRIAFAYLRDCTAAYNRIDGFNYHNASNPAGQAIALEYRCHSYDNGNWGDTGGTYNASTAHDGMTVIRVSGLYFNTFGPVVADVNGCLSYNVDCFAGPTSLPGTGNTRASWYFDNAAVSPGTGEAWLIACGGADSLYDIHADATTTKINVLGWRGGTPKVGPNAAITKYLQ